ncbi:hypothetical protein MTO96_040739, partial [Rhipicephalus appendiculatus]
MGIEAAWTRGESVVDFLDHLSSFKTACALSEVDVLQRFLPAALRVAAAHWLRSQPPFRSWDTFVAALREELLSVDYEYRLRCALDARTQHPYESLSAYVPEMQELFRRADLRAPETVKVCHVLRQCHPRYQPYFLGHSFPSPEELAHFALKVVEPVFRQHHIRTFLWTPLVPQLLPRLHGSTTTSSTLSPPSVTKRSGEFWHAEAEVADEGRAKENTEGDDGAGGWEAAAGGADGAEDEKTECVDADNAEVVDDVNDAAGAEEKPVEEASDNKAEKAEKSETSRICEMSKR